MSEINSILNDESRDDKKLIKEIAEYVGNHNNSQLPINKQFISDIIDIILKYSEMDINYLFFNNEYGIAHWNSTSKSLNFNVEAMANKVKQSKKEWVKSSEMMMFGYFLKVIIHEITHARQDYIAKKDGNSIYVSMNNLMKRNPWAYVRYHDEMLTEKYADLRGWTLSYEVLSHIYSTKQIKKIRDFLHNSLLCGYKVRNNEDIISANEDFILSRTYEVISALDNYNNIMEKNSLPKVNINLSENMTLYDRLYLGLPISVSEYRKVRFLLPDMQYGADKSGNIKKLINKL